MEKYALTACCLISLSLFAAGPRALSAGDKVAANKKSLDEIRQQLDGKKKELEKYQQEEDLINLELDNLRKEDKLNMGRQKELESRLVRSRSERFESKEKFDSLSKAYKDLQGELYGETVIYSLDKQFYYPYCGLGDISRALLLKSAILRKQSLINKIKGETVRVQGDIQTISRQNLELKAQKELVEKRRSAHKNVVRDKMTELEKTRKKKARLLMEVENLQNAALGLTRLVRKLEKQAPYRPGSARSRDLPVPRHSLPWPVRGTVISRYGREDVPLLKTWIVREGIRIRAAEAAPVFPVMSGKVIYSGPFRAYGNVVIVDHAQGFFTIYGLLDGILVSKNDSVTPDSPLGRAGDDLLAVSGRTEKDYSAVYFEIRVGAEAVDPLIWLTN
jgi:murein hydrolase activator